MNTVRATLMAMAILFWIPCSLLRAEEEGKQSLEIVATAKERTAAIEKELTSAEQPDWAGNYFYGDLLAENVRLTLAAQAGFSFEWTGCMGVYDLNYGEIELIDGILRMRCELPNQPEQGFQGMATEYLPVRWGERRYLVPLGEVAEFCNAINAHEEPREESTGSFLLRAGDEKKRAHGQPELPQHYLSLLLPKPILARVTKIKTSRTVSPKGEPSKNWTAIPARVNAGRFQGVFEGMEFHVVDPDIVSSAKVVSLENNSAEIMFFEYKIDAGTRLPRVGWKLSTRPSYR